jgi:hypothetical protein
MRHPRLSARLSAFTILALLLAGPLSAAYVVYLKDGSNIVAREKYTVQGDRAIIILMNGTKTFVKAGEIDTRRTDEANKDNLRGSAVALPGEPQNLPTPGGPVRREKTLGDLIVSKEAAPRDLPESRRETPGQAAGRLGKTKAGFVDFSTSPRKPYPHLEVLSELQQFFRAQGIEDMELYEGTQGDRPLLEFTTNSEASVFRTLSIAANALLHVRGLFPQRVAAFELLMRTPSRERAGQFVLTPDMATEIAAKKMDVSTFFIQNVQF